ncbi:MAG TPA: hypothetical protein PK858_06425, partial [Saprospiraceae bacterium]|nr:hypothetical protein [Saprospiraceae bacterium]
IQKSRHIKVQIPAADPQADWALFTHPDRDSTAWKNTGDAAYMADWLTPGGALVQGYELLVKETGWAGAGKDMANGNGGSLCADLPPNLNPQNTVVFLVFKKSRTVIQLDSGASAEDFCSLQLPPGEPVRLVTVSKFGDSFWAATLEDETGFSASVKSLIPVVKSEQEVIDLLRGL